MKKIISISLILFTTTFAYPEEVITLTFPDDAKATRVRDAYCLKTNYDAKSGLTKRQWLKNRIKKHIRETAAMGETNATHITNRAKVKSDMAGIVIN